MMIKIDAQKKIEIDQMKYPHLTRRQFKLALLDAGLLDTVEQRINSIADAAARTRIQIEYNESTEFQRTSDSVKFMSELLELSDNHINEMWEHALTL